MLMTTVSFVAASGPRVYPHFSPITTDNIDAVMNKYAKFMPIFVTAIGSSLSVFVLQISKRMISHMEKVVQLYDIPK